MVADSWGRLKEISACRYMLKVSTYVTIPDRRLTSGTILFPSTSFVGAILKHARTVATAIHAAASAKCRPGQMRLKCQCIRSRSVRSKELHSTGQNQRVVLVDPEQRSNRAYCSSESALGRRYLDLDKVFHHEAVPCIANTVLSMASMQ